MNRREFTKVALGASTVGLTALAGCTGDDEADADTGDTGDSDSSNQQTGTGSTDSQETQKQTKEESGGLELLSHEWYEEDYTAGVKGSAVNNTGDELGYVGVEVIFLDSDGAQIENGLDNTTDLPDGREWKFDAVFIGSDPSVVADYEISISDSPF